MRKLRDRMHEDLTLRGLSARTIDSYLPCVRKFAEHFGRSPSTLGAEEIRELLLHLRARKLSASTFNVYTGAIKFLYRVTLEQPEQVARIPRMRVPIHLPTVLRGSEMARPIAALETDNHRALVMLAYGARLRASEACKLCIEPGKREVFDADRFVVWVEVLLEAGDGVAARTRKFAGC